MTLTLWSQNEVPIVLCKRCGI